MRVQGSQKLGVGVVGAAAVLLTGGAVVSGADLPQVPPLVEQAAGVTNPDIPETCGLDAVLVLDASGSISSSNAVSQVRDAGAAFLDALADTGSTARVLQFASLSQQLAPQTDVTQSAVDSGVFRDALDDYYNPKPPRPGNVNIYSYDGSDNPPVRR